MPKEKKMNKKQLLSAACAFVLFAPALFSEPLSFDAVCAGLAAHPNTTGNFTQVKTIQSVNRSLKSSGTFLFSLDGIMWKTEKPFPSTLAAGLSSVIQITPDGKKNVTDVSSNSIFASISSALLAMFSGNPAGLNENFSVNFSSAGSEWSAVLEPKDQAVAAVIRQLSASGTCSESDAALTQILMTEASGDTIAYSFSAQKYPKELTADEKAFFAAE